MAVNGYVNVTEFQFAVCFVNVTVPSYVLVHVHTCICASLEYVAGNVGKQFNGQPDLFPIVMIRWSLVWWHY